MFIFSFFPDLRRPQVEQNATCDSSSTVPSQVAFCSTYGYRKLKIWKELKKFPKFGRNHVACGSSLKPLRRHAPKPPSWQQITDQLAKRTET